MHPFFVVTLKVISNESLVLKIMFLGFFKTEVPGTPFWKVQFQDAILLVSESVVFVKLTDLGIQPISLSAIKFIFTLSETKTTLSIVFFALHPKLSFKKIVAFLKPDG